MEKFFLENELDWNSHVKQKMTYFLLCTTPRTLSAHYKQQIYDHTQLSQALISHTKQTTAQRQN